MCSQLAVTLNNVAMKLDLGLSSIEDDSKEELAKALFNDMGYGACKELIDQFESQKLMNEMDSMFNCGVYIDPYEDEDSGDLKYIEVRKIDNDDACIDIMANPTDRAMDLEHEDFKKELAYLKEETGFSADNVHALFEKFEQWYELNGRSGIEL